jgi:hypothetical protein
MTIINFTDQADRETFNAHANHSGVAHNCVECLREERRDADYFTLVADLMEAKSISGFRL